MERRDFLAQACLGILGTGALLGGVVTPDLFNVYAQEKGWSEDKLLSAKRSVTYRTLGRSGLKVSEVGIGAMITTEASVIEHAIDLGVNYIDTAAAYQGGNNERMLGGIMKRRRNEVILATKVHPGSPDSMMASVERSLRSLQTSYVDLLQLHGLDSEEAVNRSDWMNVMATLKKQGKIRLAGVSTHSNMARVIRAAARGNFYDVVLTRYNFKADQDLVNAIAEGRKAGLGIVAMKTMMGGYRRQQMGWLNPFQAALKWVLSDRNVDTTIPSATSTEQVDQNFLVMGAKITFDDRKTLAKYGELIDRDFCRMCGDCGLVCRKGVKFTDILRFLMYAEGYGEPGMARGEYALLSTEENAARCLSCRRCLVSCRHRMDLGGLMKKAHALLA